MLGLSADYFTAQSTGTLISRVGVGSPVHRRRARLHQRRSIREPITFLVLFGYALYLNWRLTLITLLIFPPLAWVFSATGRNLKRYIGKHHGRERAALLHASGKLRRASASIKTFRLEKYVRKKFRERSDSVTRDSSSRPRALEEAAHPMVELLFAVR